MALSFSPSKGRVPDGCRSSFHERNHKLKRQSSVFRKLGDMAVFATWDHLPAYCCARRFSFQLAMTSRDSAKSASLRMISGYPDFLNTTRC